MIILTMAILINHNASKTIADNTNNKHNGTTTTTTTTTTNHNNTY